MKIRIIDTHCHPQFPQYDADREQMLARAADAGVGMVCVGTDRTTSEAAVALASRYEGVWASIGVHPNAIGEDGSSDSSHSSYSFDWIRDFIDAQKVVAIGEVGLDYYRTEGEDERVKQRKALESFITIAAEKHLPLIIHCRDAHDDLRRILESAMSLKPTGIVHSYNGDIETALHYISRGFYIGLNAIISFSGQYSPMVQALPMDRIVVETDSPYLAPAPYRGKRNEPVYVTYVAAHICALKEVAEEQALQQLLKNSIDVFNRLLI